MSLIILPGYRAPENDPDRLAAQLAEQGVRRENPTCQRCGVEASLANPIGATQRKPWEMAPRFSHRHFDFICARCREGLRR